MKHQCSLCGGDGAIPFTQAMDSRDLQYSDSTGTTTTHLCRVRVVEGAVCGPCCRARGRKDTRNAVIIGVVSAIAILFGRFVMPASEKGLRAGVIGIGAFFLLASLILIPVLVREGVVLARTEARESIEYYLKSHKVDMASRILNTRLAAGLCEMCGAVAELSVLFPTRKYQHQSRKYQWIKDVAAYRCEQHRADIPSPYELQAGVLGHDAQGELVLVRIPKETPNVSPDPVGKTGA